MSLNNLQVVLVHPLYGGNVGSVCRAMANTGLSSLVLVKPSPLDPADVHRMACAAFDLYEKRREFPTLAEAVADCGLVVGTTSRIGLYRAHVQTPRDLAPRILDTARCTRVALVFGQEKWGLTNEDLLLCNQLIQIPSADHYPSLNLAQAVLICGYELFVASGTYQPVGEGSPEAPSQLRERMFQMWEDALLSIGFMEREKALHMMLGVRRIFARAMLTEDDVRIMMGIARQAKWKAGQAPGTPSEPPGEDRHPQAGG